MRKKNEEILITAGADTHKDTHTVAALDSTGRLLGVTEFAATAKGYTQVQQWLEGFGKLDCIGIEGTGSYGAGLSRSMSAAGIRVVEVSCPNRQLRRRKGKSDPVDAESAARAALAGHALGTPKSQDGPIEAMRLVRVERRSAIKARTQAGNQLHGMLASAPESLRQRFGGRTVKTIVRTAASFRVSYSNESLDSTVRYVLRGLARRWLMLNEEVNQLDKLLKRMVNSVAPHLTRKVGIGAEVASTLLVAVGDNPERLRNEASFAALCGVSPVDASSGRQRRHRLNRGGNRDANRALWVIAFVRMRCDSQTKEYMEKRTKEGLSRLEITRCLKRYIARDLFKILRPIAATQLKQDGLLKVA
jgi:transposase